MSSFLQPNDFFSQVDLLQEQQFQLLQVELELLQGVLQQTDRLLEWQMELIALWLEFVELVSQELHQDRGPLECLIHWTKLPEQEEDLQAWIKAEKKRQKIRLKILKKR